jgi:uncharacterized protein (TIGR00290 family)
MVSTSTEREEERMAEKILLCWSGGKDSALSLYEIQHHKGYEVVALLTTITEEYDRVSMHGIRRVLLKQQAESLNYPLVEVFIPPNCPEGEYEQLMEETLLAYIRRGVTSVAFGDIFLENVRKYREDNLAKIGMKGLFPLWKRDTTELALTFIRLGFKAVITCIDSHLLDKTFAGRAFDKRFLTELPPQVDQCGENGEFHTFVFDGPLFQKMISHAMGEVVLRNNRFYYCDVVSVPDYAPAERI